MIESIARKIPTIQNLVTILLSWYPFFWKWWCKGDIRKILFPIPYFFLVYLKYKTWIITERFSIRKIPQIKGISHSFLTAIEITAIIPPIVKLPVSPIKTWAGYVLYHKNPTSAPTKAPIKKPLTPQNGAPVDIKR